ncbi:unnamed protein product [Caenorhabditis brenneri]
MANHIVFIVLIIYDCLLTANGSSDFNSPFVFEEKVYINHGGKNFVSSTTIRDEVTGSLTTEYRDCLSPQESKSIIITARSGLIYPGETEETDYFKWKCSRQPNNGLSIEPITCLLKDRNGKLFEMKPGESNDTGLIRHTCDIINGGLTRVTEFVHGCYHNGTVYRIGEKWREVNPGDRNSSAYVIMECYRSESGYFDKRVIGCENDDCSDEAYKTLIKYDMYIKLNSFLNFYSDDEEIKKCVETEPGHVALIAADRKETDCVYAGVSHPITTSWSDKSKAARFWCSEENKVFKSYCEIDECININSEHKLSNGCTFVCDSKKNIYKCDNQLPNMQVMKSK